MLMRTAKGMGKTMRCDGKAPSLWRCIMEKGEVFKPHPNPEKVVVETRQREQRT